MDPAIQALFAQPVPTPEQLAARNAPYVAAGAQPALTPPGVTEPGFQNWVTQNNVPVTLDYDMRGFFNAMRRGDPGAVSAVDPNDQRLHYPDTYKMPSHQSFSSESRWAGPMAPQWNAQDQLVSPGGRILYDERAQPQRFTEADRAREMLTFGQMGRQMQAAGVPLPGPGDPLSANVEDKTSPLYSRAAYQNEAKRRAVSDMIERLARP